MKRSSDTDRLLPVRQRGNTAILICQFDRDLDDWKGGGSFGVLACRDHKSVAQLSPIDHPSTRILCLYYHYGGGKGDICD